MSDLIVEEEEQDVFFPGDLLWTKIGPYPFWPCMVTYAPSTGVHIRQVERIGKIQRRYHVQYFGDGAQRGWTPYGNSNYISFKGENKYFERVNTLKSLKKSVDKYKVQESHKIKWQIAVKEAEEALLLQNRRSRFENYVFRFEKTKDSNGTDLPMDLDETFNLSEPSTSKKIRLSMKSDAVCDACQERNVDFSCSRQCGNFFHLGCYGLINMPKSFKCIDCLSGIVSANSSSHQGPLCFICNLNDDAGKVIKCSLFKCLNYYHLTCLSNEEKKIAERGICPHHTCFTCYRNDCEDVVARKGPFVKCVKCLSAFHSQETCIPAGAVQMSELEIICPLHFLNEVNVYSQDILYRSTCIICSHGGVCFCCKTCPNAIHRECLPPLFPANPDEFLCLDCRNRQYLYHGMVVWAISGIQWWLPSKIICPSELPEEIKNEGHSKGEFAVKYYGLDKYSWTHTGRVYPFADVHFSCEPLSIIDKKIRKEVKKGYKTAARDYKKYMKIDTLVSNERPPREFRHLKINRALSPAHIIKDYSCPVCNCDPTSENPCGPESACLNRSTLMECHPEFCPAKDLCQNQKFLRREYAATKLILTNSRGWGLQTINALTTGEFIIEYVGEIISHEEYRKRSKALQEAKNANYYFLYLDAKRMIDAGPMGNYSRFINHSCEPNCEMRKWSVNGDARIGIFAIRNISPGEEITFDYQSDKYQFSQQCFCGAASCRRFIGRKKSIQNSNSSISKMNSTAPSSQASANNLIYSIKPKVAITNISKASVIEAGPSNDSASSINVKTMDSSLLPKVVITRLSEEAVIAATGSLEGIVPNEHDAEVSISVDSTDHSENHCFICKEPGCLIICDEIGCVRAYHLLCVGLAVPPEGIWSCAIHRCSVCGQPPQIFCRYCPMSICNECWTFGKPPVNFACQLCELKNKKKYI